MKRLNPETGKPFKHGDVRADGFIFWSYGKTVIAKKTGYFTELWKHPEKFAVEKRKNKDRKSKWCAANPEKRKAMRKAWHKANPQQRLAEKAKRRAAKLNRTPPWLSKEQLQDIADFYTIAQMFRLYTGQQYHVDHIVPLQGKKVSGLHVPWNLQVLPAMENIAKNNKHPIC